MAMAGCLSDNRASRDRGAAGLFENTETVHAPLQSRCKKLGSGAAGKRCDEAKYLAEIYVRKLSSGDQVCLDGGFGDEPGGACRARASVQDVAPQGLLLELRNPKPDSKWFNKDANQIWFEEGALVDLYLQDHGY